MEPQTLESSIQTSQLLYAAGIGLISGIVFHTVVKGCCKLYDQIYRVYNHRQNGDNNLDGERPVHRALCDIYKINRE